MTLSHTGVHQYTRIPSSAELVQVLAFQVTAVRTCQMQQTLLSGSCLHFRWNTCMTCGQRANTHLARRRKQTQKIPRAQGTAPNLDTWAVWVLVWLRATASHRPPVIRLALSKAVAAPFYLLLITLYATITPLLDFDRSKNQPTTTTPQP